MIKYETLNDLLDDLSPDKKQQVFELRSYILAVDHSLVERIKWNAPSYVKDGEDRLSYGCNPQRRSKGARD